MAAVRLIHQHLRRVMKLIGAAFPVLAIAISACGSGGNESPRTQSSYVRGLRPGELVTLFVDTTIVDARLHRSGDQVIYEGRSLLGARPFLVFSAGQDQQFIPVEGITGIRRPIGNSSSR